ncbi:3-methyl-2-oxobutanoate hydroxymethyltransferase, partial [Rouxiella sp. T17]|uniref:3-methyl-2-oxobutanoate hydroxymethyltransferase n=1 Tax=Rouxiella sp. T17 TaxID=3085684 RepID=UPI002FC6BD85
MPEITLPHLQKMKKIGEKIAMLTCYDATFAHESSQAGVDMLLIWTDPTTVDKFCPHDEACSKASGLTPP